MVVVTHEPFPAEKEPMIPTSASKEPEHNNGENGCNALARIPPNVPFEVKDVKTALDVLHLAINLGDRVLLQKCIEFLDEFLNVHNVVHIYYELCKVLRYREYEPSAPPMVENDQRLDTDSIKKLISDLRHNCLLEIDKNANIILGSKDILELSLSDILDILSRDTLQVSSEAVVYKTVYNWAVAECHRRGTVFRKEVLQDLIYTVRYGLMSKDEFMSKTLLGVEGPRHSNILEEKEWRLIKFYIKEKSKGRPVNPLDRKMSEPRILGNEKPFDLSHRSRSVRQSENTHRKENTASNKECTGRTLPEKCLVNVLSCWSFLFD